jgi:hypothetical protein
MASPEACRGAGIEWKVLRILRKGDREAAAGRGHDLEDVLKEAERILAGLR